MNKTLAHYFISKRTTIGWLREFSICRNTDTKKMLIIAKIEKHSDGLVDAFIYSVAEFEAEWKINLTELL
jgi:hypothetical protein